MSEIFPADFLGAVPDPSSFCRDRRSVDFAEPDDDLVKQISAWGGVVPVGQTPGGVAQEMADISAVIFVGFDHGGRGLAEQLEGISNWNEITVTTPRRDL